MCGVLLASCGAGGLVSCAASSTGPDPFVEGAHPFAPTVLRVYPLTQLVRDESGAPRIILHIELRDRWGDTCKGLGELSVQLYRPVGAGLDASGEVADLRWTDSLLDLERNAALFDPSTRTYRLNLSDLPAWMGEMLDDRGPRYARLKVTLEAQREGESYTLWDDFIIQR